LSKFSRATVKFGWERPFLIGICSGKQPYVRLDHLLLIDSEDEGGLPQGVLLEFVTKFEEEPELVERFKDTFRLWSSHLGMLSMNDNYKPYINALGRIAHIKPLAEIFVNMPEFLRDVLPHDIERAMLLGPFFRISPLQPEASSQYFSNAKPKTDVNIRDATSALRMATRALQEQLAQIVTAFCKISDHVRSRVLSFFAKVINANKKRAAINVDHSSVASDAFMINISAVLNRLCEPFMDASFSKVAITSSSLEN
jgi:ubiquitin conjugation factor E4 B